MTIDEIRALIRLVQDTQIAELEVHWGSDSVRIRTGGGSHHEVVLAAANPASAGPAPEQSFPPSVGFPPPYVPPAAASEVVEDERNLVVKSPIVGTYYDSPSPAVAAFVKVGDVVHPKQVLCIIESMKLMNEIESEVAGTVVAKLVENGRPVEYGESLFTIRPL